MCSLANVIYSISAAVDFKPKQVSGAKVEINFRGNSLHEKINARLLKLSEDDKIEFVFVGGLEIGELTGNDFLRLLIDILNDGNLFKTGNCVLFSVNGEYCVALMIFKLWHIETTTTPLPSDEPHNKFLFTKLFDDDGVEKYSDPSRKYNQYYKESNISNLRANLYDQFTNFLQTKISNFTDIPLRSSFFGVLQDISRRYIKTPPISTKDKKFNEIPVAACVKLALETNQSGKLQRVFGQHGLDTQSLVNKYRANFQSTENRNPTDEEIKAHIIEKKAELRMEAAKEIIAQALSSDKTRKIQDDNGNYNMTEVKRVIKEIKDFYQVE